MDESFAKRKHMRLLVLKYLLGLRYDYAAVITVDDIVSNCKITKNQANRCMGDLSKALRICLTLDANFESHRYTIIKPSLFSVAEALEIAITDGTCTSWCPDQVG